MSTSFATAASAVNPVALVPDDEVRAVDRRLDAFCRPPTPAEIKRHDIAAASRFSRDLRAMCRIVAKLKVRLERLADATCDDILKEWVNAGVKPEKDDERAKGIYEMVNIVSEESAGFLWAVLCFDGTIHTQVMGDPEEDESQQGTGAAQRTAKRAAARAGQQKNAADPTDAAHVVVAG
jgi:hypothetical protein